MRAGDLSNYLYGYGIAASGSSKGFAELAAFGAGLKHGKDGDNPKDSEAMRKGFDAYWQEHPEIKRHWYQH